MRRAITNCDPTYALAGDSRTWHFIYTPSTGLPKGTKLKFDLQSSGREIDWEIPSTNLKKSGGVIYAVFGKGKTLQATEIPVKDSPVPQFEFILPSALEAGTPFTIIMGVKEGGDPKKDAGIRAQTVSQRRRSFLLYIDTSGKGRFDEPEPFVMDVRGNKLANIRILAPSFVAKNKRFDIIARFEDEFGNLTSNAPDDTLIELTHEHIRENLNWKLFVPETGFITLPNLYFNDEGFYTIQLKNTATKAAFFSSPLRCFPDNTKNLYWGTFHGESERYDATDNIENCLRHFRDDKAYHFHGVSPFESIEETSNETWKLITQNLTEFNEDERFITFSGCQWTGEPKSEGHRILLFSKDGKQLLRKKDLKSNTLKKIYKSFSPKELISIPSFTMAKGADFNFSEFDPEYERVAEIYNAWGSSECTAKEGNPRPIKSTDQFEESAGGSIQKALQANCRFGFVAGGLDDRGLYDSLYESDQEQYSPGLTAIAAPTQTKEALTEAIYQRSCYATTGERIIVGITVAGIPMGKETSTVEKPGLVVNRHIVGYVAGTSQLKTVEIIRNGKVLKTFEPTDYFLDFTYDDMTPLEKVSINAKDKKPPFTYYYLRVTQVDGHMAWSSPIWVDYIPLSQIPKKQNNKPVAKPVPKNDFIDEDDDFEDEEEDDIEEFDED